jgi:signal peptidase II
MTQPARHRLGRLLILAAVVGTIGCDRVTKHVASTMLAGTPGRSYLGDTVRFGYVENPGGFLSIGATLSPEARLLIFTAGTGVMLLGIALVALRRGVAGWAGLGLALFIAGGASNWIDRLVRGSVVDFLVVGVGPLRTGVFNIADVAIMLGAALVVLAEFRPSRDAPSGRGPADPLSR